MSDAFWHKHDLPVLGFPEFILDPQQLDREYEGFEIKEDEYFYNNIKVNRYALKKSLSKLDQMVNKSR